MRGDKGSQGGYQKKVVMTDIALSRRGYIFGVVTEKSLSCLEQIDCCFSNIEITLKGFLAPSFMSNFHVSRPCFCLQDNAPWVCLTEVSAWI